MNKKYIINIYKLNKDKVYDTGYSWFKLDSISDLWTCIGWYINLSDNMLSINYLEYYNEIFDDIESYIKRVIETQNGVVLRANSNNIIFKIEEEKR